MARLEQSQLNDYKIKFGRMLTGEAVLFITLIPACIAFPQLAPRLIRLYAYQIIPAGMILAYLDKRINSIDSEIENRN